MKPKCCRNKKTAADLKKVVGFLKVVAEENRLKILCLLRPGEKCVCEIWKIIGLPQNLTSHHLKILKDFGLVNDRKDGLKVFYSINKKSLTKFNLLLNNFLQAYEK